MCCNDRRHHSCWLFRYIYLFTMYLPRVSLWCEPWGIHSLSQPIYVWLRTTKGIAFRRPTVLTVYIVCLFITLATAVGGAMQAGADHYNVHQYAKRQWWDMTYQQEQLYQHHFLCCNFDNIDPCWYGIISLYTTVSLFFAISNMQSVGCRRGCVREWIYVLWSDKASFEDTVQIDQPYCCHSCCDLWDCLLFGNGTGRGSAD